MNQDERTGRADALAQEVLKLSRSTLLVHLRFLDAVLNQISPAAQPGGSLATDGQTMYYDPRHVLRSYQAERTAVVRDYLHLVLHCVFRHMYVQQGVDRAAWDLACDIAVEHTISGLELPVLAAGREARQQKVCAALREQVGMLTAEKIYRALLEQRLPPAELQRRREAFLADDHRLWYEGRDLPRAESAWRDISRRMQVDMETFAKRQGDKAGALMLNLRAANRETWDYDGFLRKFAARGEAMKLDPDEFDYIFYTYGMQLYKKVPLIEPVEYKDVKRVREFVVALDLSADFPDEWTRFFLRRTWAVLQSTESFFSKVRLHILACTPAGVEHTALTGQEDLDAFLERGGFGRGSGGDFRPVFRQMDEMVRRREFENLKGLIVLTDGYGVFPAKKPDYETAFVFVNDDYSVPEVPSWAIRLVLQKDEMEGQNE